MTFAPIQSIGGTVNSVASSISGQYMIANDANGDIPVSNDYGQSWTVPTTNGSTVISISSVAISGDGQYMVATGQGAKIYRSMQKLCIVSCED